MRLVSRSPDERHAVVLIDYNRSEPYAVFCERRAAGWVASIGIGAGDNTSLGNAEADVQTTWDPPSAIWGIPGPSRLTDEFLEGDE